MRTILVTSPQQACGKSTVVLNLAHHYLQQGEAVTLVDYSYQKSLAQRVRAVPGMEEQVALIESSRHKGRITSWLRRVPAGTERLIIDTPNELQGRERADLLFRSDALLFPVELQQLQTEQLFPQMEMLLRSLRAYRKRFLVIVTRYREESAKILELREFLGQYRVPLVAKLAELGESGAGGWSGGKNRQEWERVLRLLDSDLVQLESVSGTPLGRRLNEGGETSLKMKAALRRVEEATRMLIPEGGQGEFSITPVDPALQDPDILHFREKNRQLRERLRRLQG